MGAIIISDILIWKGETEMKGKVKDEKKAKITVRTCAEPKVLYILVYCWRIIVQELLALIRGKEERGGIKCGYLY